MSQKPYRFRAVHSINTWRKASHETFERATTIGNRSALALFEHRNDAINYTKEGEPLYVVVWHKDEQEGVVFKTKTDGANGLLRSSPVPRSTLEIWENQREAPVEELERYFRPQRAEDENEVATNLKDESVEPTRPTTIEELSEQLLVSIAESEALSHEVRLQRLKKAERLPTKVEVSTYAFIRNADVIVEVLHRARGHCESCGSPAPFNRAMDDSPYLEVHHIIQLSEGGEDTVSNAQALCPNCHRQSHYGKQP